jgi:hypothetical protein
MVRAHIGDRAGRSAGLDVGIMRDDRCRGGGLRSPARRVARVLVGALLAGCDGGPSTDELLLVPAPYAKVNSLEYRQPSDTAPPHDTIRVTPRGSAFYPVSALAVASDGMLAIGHARTCQVLFVDGRTGRQQGAIRVCGVDSGLGRSATDVYWVDGLTLGVFDARSEEVRVFDRGGRLLHRVPVEIPESGFISAAYPIGRGAALVAYEPLPTAHRLAGDGGSYPARLIQLREPSVAGPSWSALDPPAVFSDPRSMVPSGVVLCVQQSAAEEGRAFLSLNRWAYEVYLGIVGESDEVSRSYVPTRVPGYRPDPAYHVVTANGRFVVGCGESVGVSMRSFARERRFGGWDVDGVLEVIAFDGAVLGRIRLDADDVLARALSIGIDREGFAYALVRDSIGAIVTRQRLPTSLRSSADRKISANQRGGDR